MSEQVMIGIWVAGIYILFLAFILYLANKLGATLQKLSELSDINCALVKEVERLQSVCKYYHSLLKVQDITKASYDTALKHLSPKEKNETYNAYGLPDSMYLGKSPLYDEPPEGISENMLEYGRDAEKAGWKVQYTERGTILMSHPGVSILPPPNPKG